MRFGKSAYTRARQRALRRRQLIIGGIALAALLALGLLIGLIARPGADRALTVSTVTAPPRAEAPEAEPEPTPRPAATATPEPSAEPTPGAQSAEERARTRPTPTAEGFLPIFAKADTDEKIVAITVDDCYQAENLRQIVDKALEIGAKLTLFPIGENVLKSKQAEILKYAWEQGFEIENHTFTHNGLYAIDDDEFTAEVYKQQLAVSYILDLEYQPHFLRPKGGDARRDQRMHAYAAQLGYYGIAHWSASGSPGVSDGRLGRSLEPGAIFLFHTTDADLERLLRFIPWVAEQGYQMVTLNEMFGYPPNETAALAVPIREHTIPALEPYARVYVSYKKTSYGWGVYLLQQKLIALGYLDGEPDGVYGDGCAKAVKAYQRDHGLDETGVADAALQQAIFES